MPNQHCSDHRAYVPGCRGCAEIGARQRRARRLATNQPVTATRRTEADDEAAAELVAELAGVEPGQAKATRTAKLAERCRQMLAEHLHRS